ncbi:uncharacterized protein N7483_007587 [Penicillium malachiteum]|uniref:uncharacterized protein n=1 Tax=Penicillium malachiteum TaxID=1324776 RepID=UPI0025479292|nr:uncharacterized protein N7483_007587 [Penicillium malachiteum]KAJ5726230.1 hypothetical protein N7483_007587 [Penicillium malachiteum]
MANDWNILLSTLGGNEGDIVVDSNDQMLGENGLQGNMMAFDPAGGDKSEQMVSESVGVPVYRFSALWATDANKTSRKARQHSIPSRSSPISIASAAYRGILEGDNGMTALHLCVSKGDVRAVVILLDCGINVHAVDSQKRTALHIACFVGNVEIVAFLLQASTQTEVMDCNGYTPPAHCMSKGKL